MSQAAPVMQFFLGRRLYDIHNSECHQVFCSSRGVSFVPVYDPFALYH